MDQWTLQKYRLNDLKNFVTTLDRNFNAAFDFSKMSQTQLTPVPLEGKLRNLR